MLISTDAYLNSSPVSSARFFLGKMLYVNGREGRVGALITETEAYGGAEDRACHGFGNRRTKRTELLFAKGGVAYVYLCYGIHALLNFVTGEEGQPKAVLIRGVKIVEGQALVRRRRKGVPEANWADGPGKVSVAMGIDCRDNGVSLQGNRIWVEDHGIRVEERAVQRTPRIGVDYAGSWAKKPWRMVWSPNFNRNVSKARS